MLTLLDALFFLTTLSFKIIFFILNTLRKFFIFILTNSLLRFLFILFTTGYFFHISFKILATYYFIYLTHKSALKFNIYQNISLNLKETFQHLLNKHKVSKALKALTNDYIILNNITVENFIDECCTIDHLVINTDKIFIIKTLTHFNNCSLNFKNQWFKKTKDDIIDKQIIYSIIKEIDNCSNILRDILPYDITITKVITLTKDNTVIKYDEYLTTPIVTVKSLTKFIQNNINNKTNYTTASIKNLIIENKVWIIDKAFFKTINFLSTNKSVIGFFLIFLLLYYLYINLISILIA
jgi:hypothetical protein